MKVLLVYPDDMIFEFDAKGLLYDAWLDCARGNYKACKVLGSLEYYSESFERMTRIYAWIMECMNHLDRETNGVPDYVAEGLAKKWDVLDVYLSELLAIACKGG